jgi:hypothetical protein
MLKSKTTELAGGDDASSCCMHPWATNYIQPDVQNSKTHMTPLAKIRIAVASVLLLRPRECAKYHDSAARRRLPLLDTPTEKGLRSLAGARLLES